MALIYVIDDAPDYRFLLGQFMKKHLPQHSIRFFESGSLFCHYVGQAGSPEPLVMDEPRLILVDFHMPGLNGLQTIAYLNQFPQWQPVPVIVLTSSTDQTEISACYEAGATVVMNKSTGWQELVQTIQASLTA